MCGAIWGQSGSIRKVAEPKLVQQNSVISALLPSLISHKDRLTP